MTTIYAIKIIFAVIGFSTIVTWYTLCWLCKKNEKFEKPALVLTFVLAGMAILACVGTSLGV